MASGPVNPAEYIRRRSPKPRIWATHGAILPIDGVNRYFMVLSPECNFTYKIKKVVNKWTSGPIASIPGK